MIAAKKCTLIGFLTVPLLILGMVFTFETYYVTDSLFSETKTLKTRTPLEQLKECKNLNRKLGPDFWRTVNLKAKSIPDDIKNSASKITVYSKFVKVGGSNVHFLFADPLIDEASSIPVLLLHGQAYSAETWNKLGTISLLAACGYRTIAVDLPGYGHSPAAAIQDRAKFIDDMLIALNLKNPVVVSPSMSGAFSLNFLLSHWSKMGGFVPVSPVGSKILDEHSCGGAGGTTTMDSACNDLMTYLKGKKKPDLSCVKVPTMIVFGQRDRGMNSARLCHLPQSQAVEIPEGRHSAYNSNPPLWHKLLYNFLSILNDTLKCR